MAFEDKQPDNGTLTDEKKDTTIVETPAPDQGPFLIVGDRAYHSKDDVVKQIGSAQSHITTIETENAQLREQNEALAAAAKTAGNVDEVLNHLKNQPTEKPETDHSVSKDDWKAEVKTEIMEDTKAAQAEAIRKQNMDTAEALAARVYGDEHYEAAVAKTARELSMPMPDVNELAGSNPTAWAKIFIPADKLAEATKPTNGDVNTNALPEKPVVDKDVKRGMKFMRASSKERAAEVTRRIAENAAAGSN